MSCIFCKIAAGELPSNKAYEDERVLAFYDLNPQAKEHILIIPKEHKLSSARDIGEEDGSLIAHMFAVAAQIAREKGLDKGYRIVTNIGEDAGQTVHHLHFHLLGGEPMGTMV